jgi:integrase
MSLRRVRRRDGTYAWVARWWEGGRGGVYRSRTFDRRQDAEYFLAAIRRASQLGQLSSQVLGSGERFDHFLREWWDKYATATLAPGTLATYAPTLDKWVLPYLGHLRLRDISRETIDDYRAQLVKAGARAPTVNRSLGILQGILQRAVDWQRIAHNPVAGAPRLAHVRDEAIDAKSPEVIEAIRDEMGFDHAVLVSVLAYEGLRPGEAFALQWRDVLDDSGKPRSRVRVQRALSAHTLSTTKSRRVREPELFGPVKGDLAELYLARGGPDRTALVFPDTEGKHLRRHNWRKRVWIPALQAADVPYFRPYDLRHTCATLLVYEGRTLNEVAEHLGHADPSFMARVYTHVLRDAAKRRHVPIEEAITKARRSLRAQR